MSGHRRGSGSGSFGSGGSGGGSGGGGGKASSPADLRALLFYLLQEKLYRHAAREADAQIQKVGKDSQLLFWRAYAIGMEGGSSSIPEAIRDFGAIRAKRDVEFAVLCALLFFHKRSRVVDEEAVEVLEAAKFIAEDNASDNAIMVASRFYLFTGDIPAALELLEKVTGSETEPQTPFQQQVFSLRGWIALSITFPKDRKEHETRKEALSYLEQSRLDRDLDTIMGKAKYFSLRSRGKDLEAGLESLNLAVAMHGWFWPALVEKAKLFIDANEWDQASDTLLRVLDMDSTNLPALRLHTLCVLVRGGSSTEETVDRMRRLGDALERKEGRNAELHFEVCRSLARLCARENEVLMLCLGMIEKACSLDEGSSRNYCELGYQEGLAGNFSEAMQAYQTAIKLDEGNMAALHGSIYCQIQDGALDDAEQQLEFLSVIQDSNGAACAELCFLQALLQWRKDRKPQRHAALLDECCERLQHTVAAAGVSLGGGLSGGVAQAAYNEISLYDKYVVANPDFMLEIAKEFLLHSSSGTSPSSSGRGSSTGGVGGGMAVDSLVLSPEQRGLSLLESCLHLTPGNLEARVVTAKAHFDMGQLEQAKTGLTTLLSMRPSFSPAHILQAQIALKSDNFRAADDALAEALACDFKVRQLPVYHAVKAKTLVHQGSLDEAHTTLSEALRLPGMRDSSSSSGGGQGGATPSDRVGIFVQMIHVLAKLGRLGEAEDLIKEATALFRSTPAEVRVLIASSELCITRGDMDKAIRILQEVPKESPVYLDAQMIKANVFLEHRHDKRSFASVYRDLVKALPSAQTFVLLGEAFMRIQQPEAAIDAFENALHMVPGDAALATKVGRALVSTHDYRRAIRYYREALRTSPENVTLRHDLARLCIKLQRFEDGVSVLNGALRGSTSDLQAMKLDVISLRILGQVHRADGSAEEVIKTLDKARSIQQTIVDRTRSEGPKAAAAYKATLAAILRDLAVFYAEDERDERQATRCYKEALSACETDEISLMALAARHLKGADLEAASQQCKTVLRVNADSEPAALMLADILFLKSEFEQAMTQYERLLSTNPNNYEALARLVGLFRRCGRLEDVKAFFERAEKSNPRCLAHAGLQMCKGLYHQYANDPAEAIRHFNRARRDGEWGPPALLHMVELYLNPDGDKFWEITVTGASRANLQVAEKLLSELRLIVGQRSGLEGHPRPSSSSGPSSISVGEVGDIGGGGGNGAAAAAAVKAVTGSNMAVTPAKVRVLESYFLMAGREKASMDKAMQNFIEMLEEDKDNLPALLGMSIAFMFEESPNKARNALKRIAKMPYNTDMAEEFEVAYLLLADLYVERGKFDLAQDLSKRCLSYNKSCSKAWETMGLVMEKEQSYRDAADCYEQSWGFEHEAAAAIGFKLAFNYLKAERFVEAVDVCNKVLLQYPDYPKIREEILDRATELVRP